MNSKLSLIFYQKQIILMFKNIQIYNKILNQIYVIRCKVHLFELQKYRIT